MAYDDDAAIALYREKRRLIDAFYEERGVDDFDRLLLLANAVADSEAAPPQHRVGFMLRQMRNLQQLVGKKGARLIIEALRANSSSPIRLHAAPRDDKDYPEHVSERARLARNAEKDYRMALAVGLEWKSGRHRTIKDAAETVAYPQFHASTEYVLNGYYRHKALARKTGEPFDPNGISWFGRARVRIDELPRSGRIAGPKNTTRKTPSE